MTSGIGLRPCEKPLLPLRGRSSPKRSPDAPPGAFCGPADSGKPHSQLPGKPPEQGHIPGKKQYAQSDEEQALKERERETGDSQDQQDASEGDA